jgi:Cu(I)/Ag(I) efflux system membrane protein CusA/SilA
MVSSTLLTLIVIPAIFALVKGWSLSRAGSGTQPYELTRAKSGTG